MPPNLSSGRGDSRGESSSHSGEACGDWLGKARRVRLEVQGTVQGVGFRPYVHRLATDLGLAGWVLNGPAGVVIEIQGPSAICDRFLQRFPRELPPLARLETQAVAELTVQDDQGFRIATTQGAAARFTLVAPDIATCPDCSAELTQPADRRYGYAFTNCTNCGPRFSLIRDLPYDRVNTTMAAFAMCPDCRREYEDAANRRFHAEPIACPACGPRLMLCDASGRPLEGDPLGGAANLLRNGSIVAIKGLGGFHLACDATSAEAVSRLRRRKAREEKPLAVMVPDLAAARGLAVISDDEAALLLGPARPIVLLAQRPGGPLAPQVAPQVAPGLSEVGVMLPYTPLHHLLLAACGHSLVMTSGNLSEEPIAYRNDEALDRLSPIADAFLLHDRDIHMRCDDSVARVWEGAPRLLRRSRGFAPEPLTLPWSFTRPLLATGGELKNTFCLGRERFAFLSHHIGDLENESTLHAFESAVEHYGRLFQVTPEVIVHDLHPDYLSTRYALERAGQVELIGVQHHHAHVAAVMAEHGLDGPVLGIAWDGTGHGTDGTLWGGEFLLCDLAQFHRAGHWRPFRLPGGAAAIRQPWRTALSLLQQRHGTGIETLPLPVVHRHRNELATIQHMVGVGFNAPLSSGVGRLFDAAASIILGWDKVGYEGQAAIALEHAADPDEQGTFPVEIVQEGGVWVADSAGLAGALSEALIAGVPVPVLAARFHNSLAQVVVDMTNVVAMHSGVRDVVLCGGVFQNRLLLGRCSELLRRCGWKVHLAGQVPVNDGGLALGQAVIGGRRTCA